MTKGQIVRALVVENDATEAILLEEALREVSGVQFAITRVGRLEQGLARLGAGEFDIVLLDLSVPDAQDASTVNRLRLQLPRVPVIVLTGADNESVGIKALQVGAQDYVVKSQCTPLLLGRCVRYAMECHRSAMELHRRETRLRGLESIGLLAGGIAHDFDNLLSVISGNLALALHGLPSDSDLREHIEVAVESTEQAAHLARQFLAYAGKGASAKTSVSISEVAGKTVQLLQSTLPKNVELRTELAANLPPLLADPSQLEQVFLNLILNGVEAIGDKQQGSVTVSTGRSNGYLRLMVSDTGGGMDEGTQKRIFEPFFTTKFTGRGLGLAAVYGIVRSLGGRILVNSAVGRGTQFEIVLPTSQVESPANHHRETQVKHYTSQ